MEKDIFQVLWFDDKPQDGFKLNAYLSGIIITEAKNLIDGLNLLKSTHSWDALIFDANYKKNKDDEASLVLSDLINEVVKITKDKTPWFVLTAGDYAGIEAVSLIIPESKWEKEMGTKRFYSKIGEDEEILFDDIKKVVKIMNTPEWKLRNEYQKIYSLFQSTANHQSLLDKESEPDLNRILLALNNPQEFSNPDHFNTIRRFVAGDVIRVLSTIGVIPQTISQLNAKMYHICDKRFSDYIPVYIQQSIYSLINVCQDGSHSGNEIVDGKIPPIVEKSVKTGNAPYLFRSIVFDLLTVLWWIKDFAKERDKEINELIFSLDESTKQKVAIKVEISTGEWIKGVIVEIQPSGWGDFESLSGKWSIPQSMVKVNNLSKGDKIEITTKKENTRYIDKIKKV